MALARKNRLTGKKDFDRVFKKGKAIKGAFLLIKYVANGLKETRIGLIVPLKVSGNAVKRNRIKRVLSEELRKSFENMKEASDILVMVRTKTEEINLKKEMSNLLGKK